MDERKPKPKHNSSARTGRSGINALSKIVEGSFGWLFREQLTNDYGIDAHLEVVSGEGEVTGKLLALQVKSSGKDFVKRPRAKGWWFYPDETHVNYWNDHSLPVVLILHDESTDTTYWQEFRDDLVERTPGENWKIFVSEDQVFDIGSMDQLTKIAEGDPYVLRLRRLRLALPWMYLLRSGRRILFDVEQWVNKSSGRGSFMLRSVNEANEDSEDLGEWHVMVGPNSYATALPALFPWGEIGLHEETYEEADYERYSQECGVMAGGDIYYSEEYSDWCRDRLSDGLRSYADAGSGEVELWRLEITLNAIGEAFLLIDDFASGDSQFLVPA